MVFMVFIKFHSVFSSWYTIDGTGWATKKFVD